VNPIVDYVNEYLSEVAIMEKTIPDRRESCSRASAHTRMKWWEKLREQVPDLFYVSGK